MLRPRRPRRVLAFVFSRAWSLRPAADWPMWRGPAQNGISPDDGLPLNWSATRERRLEAAAADRVSGSTPIVCGDRVFLNVAEAPTRRVAGAVGGRSQDHRHVRWKQPMGAGRHTRTARSDMTSPSPVTDGKTVCAADRHRRAQGLRLRRQGAVGARAAEGLRRLRPQPRLRQRRRCSTTARSTCRCCTA